MRIQPSTLIHLGFGKYVRSDQVTAVVPLEGSERGPGQRTLVYLEGHSQPIVASRADGSLIRDLVQDPYEVTQGRQQQEILADLLSDLGGVNATVRRICRDQGGLDLDRLERRIHDVVDELPQAA
ncbi:MAG: hypothetical protein HC886_06995 [Leptolyngbyaceae cyanobacterium SM1_1_3]|nr:hypothetical protein [Leptolyngbyaceae cyanobacterium SM1_1_3]NJM84944.1 hypothetical protein [Leptolyngbyaceae cyanobacterium RM2_2_21]NJN01162.1 hypothetical protein [Leptolyngbyaceae cyanobacterium RM1_1_2]NJO09259.1 hypothetical protein [Leptolyngbyaceae cyanobacterium SL_1_1]